MALHEAGSFRFQFSTYRDIIDKSQRYFDEIPVLPRRSFVWADYLGRRNSRHAPIISSGFVCHVHATKLFAAVAILASFNAAFICSPLSSDNHPFSNREMKSCDTLRNFRSDKTHIKMPVLQTHGNGILGISANFTRTVSKT